MSVTATKKGPGRRPQHGQSRPPFVSRWVTKQDYELAGMPVPDVLPEAIDRIRRLRRQKWRDARRASALKKHLFMRNMEGPLA